MTPPHSVWHVAPHVTLFGLAQSVQIAQILREIEIHFTAETSYCGSDALSHSFNGTLPILTAYIP